MKKLLLTLLLSVLTIGVYAASPLTISQTDLGKTDKVYVTNAFEFTAGGIKFTTNNVNPSTFQIRGNQKTLTSNFYLFNQESFGKIKEIKLTAKTASLVPEKISLYLSNTAYTSAPTENASAIGSGSAATTVATLTAPEGSSAEYFYIQLVKGATSGTCELTAIEITYEEGQGGGDDPQPELKDAVLEFDAASTTITVGDENVDGVALKTQVTDGAITYTSSDPNVATVDAETGKVTGAYVGTATITATSAKTTTYKAGTATYELTVAPKDVPASTLDNPLTVAQALEYCTSAPKGVYVKGIVTEVTTAFDTQYNNVTFNIADSKDGTDFIVAFRTKWNEGVAAPSDNNPEVGATVVINGNLIVYVNTKDNTKTKELAAGNLIVKYEAPAGEEKVLGELTGKFGETAVEEKGNYTVEEGTQFTFTAENATSITVDYLGDAADAELQTVPFTGNTAVWTVPTAGIYTVDVTAALGEDTKKLSFDITVTEKTVNPDPEPSTGATFDFTTADLANLTTSPIEASNKTTADDANNLTGVTLTNKGVTVTFADGGVSNKPRWWWKSSSSTTELRTYAGNTMTITAPANNTLTSIEFNSGTLKDLSAAPGTLDTNSKIWTPTTTTTRDAAKVTSVTFTGKAVINSIVVNYESINTGVDDIVSDDANAPVEYYNLQGVRVANPESGLYIRVQGKKATKVLVK